MNLSKLNQSKFSALIIAFVVVLTFLPALENGTIWDDDQYSGRAEYYHSQGIEGVKALWFNTKTTAQYYPLLYTTFVLDYHFWGEDYFYPHLINVLLHALVAILLWQVLLLLKIPWGLGIALIFALHPVHVESVAWLAERKNVLSGAMYMASAWFFLKRYLYDNGKKDRWYYGFSIFFFILAMLTKTITCTLPAVLIVLMLWKQKVAHKKLKSSILLTIPFFLILGRLALLTIELEKSHAGAIGAEWDISFFERVLIAGRAIFFYVGKLIWPTDITFIYPRWHLDTSNILQWMFPALVLFFIGLLWRGRKEHGAGPLVAFLIFCGSLFPALGFFNLYPMRFSFVADHFQYLSSIAMITLLVGMVHWVMTRAGERVLRLAPILLIFVLGVYAYSSQDLQKQYKNEEVLWKSTLKKNENVFLAYNNLGVIYERKGKVFLDQAMDYYKRAVEVKPDYATALHNIASLYYKKGRTTEESKYFVKALNYVNAARKSLDRDVEYFILETGKPIYFGDYLRTHRLYGNILNALGKKEEACQTFEELHQKVPDNYKTMNQVATCYLKKKGMEKKAALLLFESIKIKPEQPQALSLMGTAYYRTGQFKNALNFLERSLKLSQKLPHTFYYLGKTYQALGEARLAIQNYNGFLDLSGNSSLKDDAKEQLERLKINHE